MQAQSAMFHGRSGSGDRPVTFAVAIALAVVTVVILVILLASVGSAGREPGAAVPQPAPGPAILVQ